MGNRLERVREKDIDIYSGTAGATIKFWNKEDYNAFYRYELTELSKYILPIANGILETMIEKKEIPDTKILEIGAGPGESSKLLLPNADIIKTDLFEDKENNIEGLDSKSAVEKYGESCDILLIINPPPNYTDYYAIYPFENIKKDNKYVIYIGELGAMDGGEGMYNYMLGNKSKWNVIKRTVLENFVTVFGDNIEKELFVFKSK